MLLQTITLPDQQLAGYRKRVDWIQRYIFPGSELASIAGNSPVPCTSNAALNHSFGEFRHALRGDAVAVAGTFLPESGQREAVWVSTNASSACGIFIWVGARARSVSDTQAWRNFCSRRPERNMRFSEMFLNLAPRQRVRPLAEKPLLIFAGQKKAPVLGAVLNRNELLWLTPFCGAA